MSTDYHLKLNCCPTCGHYRGKLAIGGSAFGWCFWLDLHPKHGINSLDDWRKVFADHPHAIEDEYGDAVSAEEMLRTITERHGTVDCSTPSPDQYYRTWTEFHVEHKSEPGPRGLLRSRECNNENYSIWHAGPDETFVYRTMQTP